MNKGIARITILWVATLVVVLAIGVVIIFGAPVLGKGVTTYIPNAQAKNTTQPQHVSQGPPPVKHVPVPPFVRSVYMSQCAASSNTFREEITSLVAETEVNSIIIDIKDFTGTVSFPRGEGVEDLGGTGCKVSDMKEFLEELHEDDIYLIGRITVFQDPLYTSVYPELAVQSKSKGIPWQDHKGLAFVDVGAKPFWDYIVDIANESYAIGFDELNFDYVRYPSDGPMSDVQFNHSDYSQRQVELEKFFRYISQKVRKPDAFGNIPVLSADLFGMTTTNSDDLTIGQVLERATPYFDYIAPMVYPSHYPRGFNGYANPNDEVYGVVKYSMDRAVERVTATTTKIGSFAYERMGTSTPAIYSKPARDPNVLRPWLQDFDYGGDYGPVEVRAQIQAAYDAGLHSWMLWAPSNYYTRGGLELAK
ncbi:hypothetical protein JXR01_01915 [Candidatus Kaiserbacteria bacterium]|nr:MAG: hypothetical protein JXR01_01915 [Candidatus Kaiserbacteria bacterium]